MLFASDDWDGFFNWLYASAAYSVYVIMLPQFSVCNPLMRVDVEGGRVAVNSGKSIDVEQVVFPQAVLHSTGRACVVPFISENAEPMPFSSIEGPRSAWPLMQFINYLFVHVGPGDSPSTVVEHTGDDYLKPGGPRNAMDPAALIGPVGMRRGREKISIAYGFRTILMSNLYHNARMVLTVGGPMIDANSLRV